MSFIEHLKSVLGDKDVSVEISQLEAASRDETHSLTPVLPDVVVWPTCTHDVAQIIKLCSQYEIGCTARGGGTGKSGGCVPVAGGLVMRFEKMNRILHIDTENLIAKVQPGVILADLQSATNDQNLFYPPDPASAAWCTIGGNIAENAGGPSALKYGVTRDYVLGLEVVLANGEIVRLGKNTTKGVTGYDLTALVCGSEGTLAIVTEATLKLIPKPRPPQTALMTFASEEAAGQAVSTILQSGILPRAIEYIDMNCLRVLKWDFAKNAQAVLMMDFDDELPIIDSAIDTTISQNEKQRRDIWNVRKNLSESLRHLKKHRISEDIVVPRNQIPHMLKIWRQLGVKYGLFTCAFGHAGDGNLHAQIFFDDTNEQKQVDGLLDELFQKTIELGGTLTGEHGVGIAKKRFLRYEQSNELLALQARVKQAFDPRGILNPGKFLP